VVVEKPEAADVNHLAAKLCNIFSSPMIGRQNNFLGLNSQNLVGKPLKGGRKPTYLTPGNICINICRQRSTMSHGTLFTDVGDKNMDVSRVVFHPLSFNAYLASLSVTKKKVLPH